MPSRNTYQAESAHLTPSPVHPMLGTVDKNHAWVIRDGQEFSVPVSGQLVCYFNDVQLEWFYENNSGWVVLDVEQVR